MSVRTQRAESELQKAAASFLREVASDTPLLTVTRCEVSDDLRYATVYITVLPTEQQEQALAFVARKKALLREYVKSHTRIRPLPFFEMALDQGERNRQRIDEISRES